MPCLPPEAAPAQGAAHLRHPHDARRSAASRSGCASLADLEPDLVVNTGDNLSHRDVGAGRDERARRPARPARRLRARVQRLLGSGAEEPAALLPAQRRPRSAPRPAAAVARAARRSSATSAGSTSRTPAASSRSAVSVIAFAGVDDPHLRYDDLDAVAGPADPLGATCGSGSPMRRTGGSSTRSPATGTT